MYTKTKLILITLLALVLSASPASAQTTEITSTDTVSSTNGNSLVNMSYLSLVTTGPELIYGNIGDQFFIRAKDRLLLDSKWGVNVVSLESAGDCDFMDNETQLSLFCRQEEYTIVFSSNYGQNIFARFAGDSPKFHFKIFGDSPVGELPYILYTTDQQATVNSPSYYPVRVANLSQITRYYSVYLRVPDAAQFDALPPECYREVESTEIVCYISVVRQSIYQLQVPLVWKQTGSFQVESFALDEGLLIGGGRQLRTVSVVNKVEGAATSQNIVYAIDKHVLVDSQSDNEVLLANMGDIQSSVTVTVTLPANQVVNPGTLPTYCRLSNNNIVCTNLNVPPVAVVQVRVPLTWLNVGSHSVHILAVDSTGNKWGSLTKTVEVMRLK